MIKGLVTGDCGIGQLRKQVIEIVEGIQTVEFGSHNDTVERCTGFGTMGCFAEEKVFTIMFLST